MRKLTDEDLDNYVNVYAGNEKYSWLADMAREFKENRAELAALQDKVRWVPVSERLPEDGKYVLASKGKSVIEAKYYYFAGNLQRHGWYQIDGMFLGVSWAEFWKEKPDAPIPAEGEND